MSDDNLDALTQRVGRLERENRWWRRCGVAAILSTAILWQGLTFAASSRVIEAEQFVVKDKDGRARARLMVGTDNSASLILYDHLGVARAWIGSRRPKDYGLPFLWFTDEDGKTRMALGYHLDGEKYTGPTIRIFEKDGKVGWSAP